ncbi:MAG: hypothetical protein K2Q45_00465 [Nitrosomonas sp.]|nr:hypothetical protein [Nitrosomonas sp.]
MNSGLKVVVYEKPNEYLDFKTLEDNDSMCTSIFLNFETFETSLCGYSFYRVVVRGVEKLREDIPLPSKACLRDHYQIGDRVYVQGVYESIILAGTVVRKKHNLYFVSFKNLTNMCRPAHEMIPFNYYVLHENCRKARKQWLFVALRCKHLCKDIRLLIAQYIWRLRNEYEWDPTLHQHTRWRSTHQKRIKYCE